MHQFNESKIFLWSIILPFSFQTATICKMIHSRAVSAIAVYLANVLIHIWIKNSTILCTNSRVPIALNYRSICKDNPSFSVLNPIAPMSLINHFLAFETIFSFALKLSIIKLTGIYISVWKVDLTLSRLLVLLKLSLVQRTLLILIISTAI